MENNLLEDSKKKTTSTWNVMIRLREFSNTSVMMISPGGQQSRVKSCGQENLPALVMIHLSVLHISEARDLSPLSGPTLLPATLPKVYDQAIWSVSYQRTISDIMAWHPICWHSQTCQAVSYNANMISTFLVKVTKKKTMVGFYRVKPRSRAEGWRGIWDKHPYEKIL